MSSSLAPRVAPAEQAAAGLHRLDWREWGVITLLLGVLSVALVATYIPDQPTLSPFDEWVYVDYVDKATSLGVAQQGETIDDEALALSSCRGVHVWGTFGSPCGGPYDPLQYPLGGVTSADIHPPTYFLATAAGAAVIRAVGLSDDLLTSSRAMGAVWLLMGLLLVVLAAVELGAPKWSAVGAAALVASLPLTRWTNSYITPDALNIAVGGALLVTAIRVRHRAWPWWSLAIIGALAGAIKTQNVLAVGATVVFLFVSAVVVARSGDVRHARQFALGGGATVFGFVAAQLLWIVLRGMLSIGPSPDTAAEAPITLARLASGTGSFVFALGIGSLPPVPAYAYLSTALVVAGSVGALLYRSVSDERFALAVGITLMVFLGSATLMVAQQAVFGAAADSPVRYGGSLLPGLAVVTATAFPTRARGIALAASSLVFAALLLYSNAVT